MSITAYTEENHLRKQRIDIETIIFLAVSVTDAT